MGKHFQKRLCLWVSIGRPKPMMWLGTTNVDKESIDRSQCSRVIVILPGKGKIEASLKHYVKNSTLDAQEISDWIYENGLDRKKNSPIPSLPFGFNDKNGVHTFEYIGIPLTKVD